MKVSGGRQIAATNSWRPTDKYMATATQDRGLANARSCVKCEYLGLLHVHSTLEYSL